MSEYVYIARANTGQTPFVQPLYYLSIARSIEGALATVEHYWPTVKMELIWNVRADNRSEMLWRYIDRRFRARLFKPAWYHFTNQDIDFDIAQIRTDNFFNFLPECSPTITPIAAGMKPEELEAKRAALLEGIAL